MRGGPSVLGIVLAGGEGKRLMPLTADRAKPAVTFGGMYRLVDFVLSSLVNGDILRICVLTQYKSHSLDRHVTTTWRMSSLLGNYVTPVPAQQRLGRRWYLGSADAILQSLNLVNDEQPDYIAVFGADHVYRMDPRQMLQAAHRERRRASPSPGSRCRAPKRPRSGSSPPPPTAPGSSGSWRSPPTLPGCRATPAGSSPPWATTSSPPRSSSTRSTGTRRTSARSTTWAARSCRCSPSGVWRSSTTSMRTMCPARARGSTATGAMWARSTRTTKPIWI